MKTEDIEFGEFTLRVANTGKQWEGIVVGKSSERFNAQSREALIKLLQSSAARTNRDFVGLDGARSRFLELFPDGFKDKNFIGDLEKGEIAYKNRMSERVQLEFPIDSWSKNDDAAEIALSLFRGINLVDLYTKNDLSRVLRSDKATRFLEICTAFAQGDNTAPANLVRDFKDDGVAKWPVLTFLPFFWRPQEHMFLKPEFTREFARRIGNVFDIEYQSVLNPDTYELLLDMTSETKTYLTDLEPTDNIDIHSFMWAVVEYKNDGG